MAPSSAPTIGDEAPNFDLTSTEDVLLMLRDECVRTAMVLYFFHDTRGDRVRDDLLALARRWQELSDADARVLGVSRAELPALKELQKELHLPFPLLHDDRGFAAAYGLEEAAEGEVPEGEAPAPVLAAVDRYQILVLLRPAVASVDAAMPEVMAALKGLPSPTASLPRKVVNRIVDLWVN
ncbi:MAG: redoxin domain-containing protein [Acidobacteriota bacterium]|nr:redoxin domain-containing protein [Acidobacteriota bacterium]MDH3523239.1 redoxin domain-containing protein [Acidobacteriota bacterium]